MVHASSPLSTLRRQGVFTCKTDIFVDSDAVIVVLDRTALQALATLTETPAFSNVQGPDLLQIQLALPEEMLSTEDLVGFLQAQREQLAKDRAPEAFYINSHMYLRSRPTHVPFAFREFCWVCVGQQVVGIPIVIRLGFPLNAAWKKRGGMRIPKDLSKLLMALSGVAVLNAVQHVHGADNAHAANGMGVIGDTASEDARYSRMLAFSDIFLQHFLALIYMCTAMQTFLRNEDNQFVALLFSQEAFNQKVAGCIACIFAGFRFRLLKDADEIKPVLREVYERYRTIQTEAKMLSNARCVGGPHAAVVRVFSLGISQFLTMVQENVAIRLSDEQREMYKANPHLCSLFVQQKPPSASFPGLTSCTRYNHSGNAGVFDSVSIFRPENDSDAADAGMYKHLSGEPEDVNMWLYRLQMYQTRTRQLALGFQELPAYIRRGSGGVMWQVKTQ
jgi:hypothetical protein